MTDMTDPPVFNGGILDGPVAPRHAATVLARMRRHHAAEKALREDEITRNLEDAWRAAIAVFKATR